MYVIDKVRLRCVRGTITFQASEEKFLWKLTSGRGAIVLMDWELSVGGTRDWKGFCRFHLGRWRFDFLCHRAFFCVLGKEVESGLNKILHTTYVIFRYICDSTRAYFLYVKLHFISSRCGIFQSQGWNFRENLFLCCFKCYKKITKLQNYKIIKYSPPHERKEKLSSLLSRLPHFYFKTKTNLNNVNRFDNHKYNAPTVHRIHCPIVQKILKLINCLFNKWI